MRRIAVVICVGVLPVAYGHGAKAMQNNDSRHIQAALRMMGHEILLKAGDSLSRVLPVEKQDDSYKVRFGSDFSFDPDWLSLTIDSIVRKTGIANSYLVEMQECLSGKIVHSYEIRSPGNAGDIPCQGRIQSKGCYTLWFTVLDTGYTAPAMAGMADGTTGTKRGSLLANAFLVLVMMGLVVLYLYNNREKKGQGADGPHIVSIGSYRFDTRNMTLSLENETIELTSKESDLLLLLHTSANSTVERDVILNAVWGDEGDYVGRTLDVFISKLRKKLEADSSLRIVNIRGVGYKLIVN